MIFPRLSPGWIKGIWLTVCKDNVIDEPEVVLTALLFHPHAQSGSSFFEEQSHWEPEI
jgi:hypothetical protein